MRTIAIALAVVGSLALCSAADAAYPGANGRIAFYRADGYIYSIRSDGTGLLKLGLGASPSYSPDGKRIAFTSASGGVWTMNANGTNRQRVIGAPPYVEPPTWSPDGARLAFVSCTGTGCDSGVGWGIFTLRSTPPYGTLKRVDTTPPPDSLYFYQDSNPAWATNGLIYFTRETTPNEGFCEEGFDTMSANPSTHLVREWRFLAVESDPAPLSRTMVYHYAYNDGSCDFADGIYIADIDGSRPRAVTPLSSTSPHDSQPVFSPDATKVAFQRGRYVYTINANGTGRHQLVVGSAPSWQPLP